MSGLDALDLIHYSHEPVCLDDRRPEQTLGLKPQGLWVSVGTEWLDWCRSEEFRTDREWLSYSVTLAPSANMLTLRTPGALDDFTMKYGVEMGRVIVDKYYIDWPRVSEQYDGILIAPYQWSRRMSSHTFWYYGWDVASGCVWNRDALADLLLAGGS